MVRFQIRHDKCSGVSGNRGAAGRSCSRPPRRSVSAPPTASETTAANVPAGETQQVFPADGFTLALRTSLVVSLTMPNDKTRIDGAAKDDGNDDPAKRAGVVDTVKPPQGSVDNRFANSAWAEDIVD
jgi:hypothetical protein